MSQLITHRFEQPINCLLMTMDHRGIIEIIGINPFVRVAVEVAERLAPGQKRPIPVLLSVAGMTNGPWKINLMPRGNGSFYLYLSQRIRYDVDVEVGDTITYSLKLDTHYENGPQHKMPGALRAALDGNEVAASNWHALPPSRQKEVLRYLSELKTENATNQNLARLLRVLSGHTGRYLARDWKDGK